MASNDDHDQTKSRSRCATAWFDDKPPILGMNSLYCERSLIFGMTSRSCSRRPIIGISQTGSDISPCNRHHTILAQRVREGIRDAGGVPLEFPVHQIQETLKRPTAALDRNLQYLSLVEILHGYPMDGVVLTIGCDKTPGAALMAAATVNIPAIALSGGPMLDGWHGGRLAGPAHIGGERERAAGGGRDHAAQFIEMVAASRRPGAIARPRAGACR